jgi:polysaccharide pyruvyl transferase CsaB
MPDAVRILISGYYGYANPGDEAILTVLLSELRRNIPDAAVSVISGAPERTAADHGVNAILWSDPSAIGEAVKQSDLVISGGGGIFHDYGGYAAEGLLSEGNWGLGFHVTAGLLAMVLGKPHVLYGVGVGPLFTDRGRQYVRALCAGASLISVRDEASAVLLKDAGVPPERVKLTADPAFLFEPASPERAAEILAAEAVPQSELLVGVALRHWAHGVDLAAWETEMAAGLDLFLRRHEKSTVAFIQFQELSGEQENDLSVARRVHEKMTLRERALVLQGSYTPAEKAAVLGRCQLVAAMRLHAIIFSASAGVPFVALTYDEKVRQVLRRLERPELGIETAALRSALLVAKMESALALPAAKTDPLKELARENTRAVQAVLAQGGRAVKPLDGESVPLVREAVLAQLTEQKRLRAWLRDQQHNYDYQIGEQRKQIDLQHSQIAQLDASLADERQGRTAERTAKEAEAEAHRQTQQRFSVEVAALQSNLSQTRRTLDETEERRKHWEHRAGVLEAEKADLQAQLAALKALHEGTVSDWTAYADEMDRKLNEYRGQRAWRGMLALRKAYVLWARKGWRLRMIPWVWSALRGGGGVESEQLEFPLRPKPRGK